jgi:uncharacterized membrane protein SpoIIM required for sporulation
VILDLPRFLASERPFWTELEERLDWLEADPHRAMDLGDARRLHYLHQRASADLARLQTSASEPETRAWLESLVSRAYGEVHETRDRSLRLRPLRLLLGDFPRAFRRRAGAFGLACAIVLGGALFGSVALAVDPDARQALLPGFLERHPAERVRQEEARQVDRLAGERSRFGASLATHNTQVALLCLALGITYGLGTALLLFVNGVMIGAVATDYIAAAQTKFLLGWLLPHGVIEIPAILIAGQAGLVLAGALLGSGDAAPLRERLAAAGRDVAALTAGLACLLLWAGLMESFLSQYHEPVLPYALKIGVGVVEGAALAAFLLLAGRRQPRRQETG